MRAEDRSRWNHSRPGTPPFDTACVAPWVSLELDPEGWVYSCCASQLYPLGRIGESRLADLWNGARAGVLKTALQAWDMSIACQSCRFAIEHGRMDPVAEVYDHYPVGEPQALPHVMMFALSNRCNLGCTMCSPALSSRLRAEAGMAPLESPYDDQFFDDLEPFVAALSVAKFLGGEPFLAPEHRRVWEMMDRLGTSPKIEITTNGTVWTPLVDWLTNRFHVDISVSVDAVRPDTYRSIRRGGEFEALVENLDRFAERCTVRGTNLHLSYCLMVENFEEFPEFLVWAEQYTFGPPVTVSNVSNIGKALFDLPTSELVAVQSSWLDADRRIGNRLERNAGVWQTQLEQLDAVIRERVGGKPTQAPRAVAIGHELFAPPTGRPPKGPARTDAVRTVERHRTHLERWSEGGGVAELTVNRDGEVTSVDHPHSRLGITVTAAVGRPLADLVHVMETADGRTARVIDHDERDDATLRTFVLTEIEPVRGVPGSIVRMVEVPHADGAMVLIAEDRIYDRLSPSAQPVQLSLRRPAESP